MKGTEKEKEFITKNLNVMSSKKIAESLERTPKMIGSYLWKNHITRGKSIKNVVVVSKKVVVDTVKTTLTDDKFRKTNIKNFVSGSENSEKFKEDLSYLFFRIRKCASKKFCSSLAGHKKIKHITKNIFCRNSTNEFLYFVEKEEKSFFVKTNIFVGEALFTEGKSITEKLDDWMKKYKEIIV